MKGVGIQLTKALSILPAGLSVLKRIAEALEIDVSVLVN